MKQLICDACMHTNVCQYKNTFKSAVKAVNETKVMVSGPKDECFGEKYISEIDFIKEPKLDCKHYRGGVMER